MKTFIRSLSLGLVATVACLWTAGIARGDEPTGEAPAEAPAAEPAAAPEAAPAAGQTQSEFVGNWKVADGKGLVFYIILKNNGAAGSVWIGKEDQDRNESGRWKEVNGAAEVSWLNGWHEVIAKEGEGYIKKGFAPKLTTDGEPSNQSSAEKVDAIPSAE